MNKIRNQMACILLPVFSACSIQATQAVSNADSTHIDSAATVATISLDNALPAPDLTKVKAGKTLKLVRIMEGGACKNNQQGAVGMFRLYADPDDIDRIEQNEGAGAFADFERRIEAFSMLSLQQAIDRLDFQVDSSALNEGDAQQKLADELANSFIDFIADDIAEFEAETMLTIDVIPLPDSLIIYLNACKTPHDH